MNTKLFEALSKLSAATAKFHWAEVDARKTLEDVLEPAGKYGVSICPEDYTGCLYVATAEPERQKFFPVTCVRYWDGGLQVYLSEYEDAGDMGWKILPGGKWWNYVGVNVDTWLLLDLVCENLEYADGYQD